MKNLEFNQMENLNGGWDCGDTAAVAGIAAGVPYLAGAVFLWGWTDVIEGICEQA